VDREPFSPLGPIELDSGHPSVGYVYSTRKIEFRFFPEVFPVFPENDICPMMRTPFPFVVENGRKTGKTIDFGSVQAKTTHPQGIDNPGDGALREPV
jgi:hypothetical protein